MLFSSRSKVYSTKSAAAVFSNVCLLFSSFVGVPYNTRLEDCLSLLAAGCEYFFAPSRVKSVTQKTARLNLID